MNDGGSELTADPVPLHNASWAKRMHELVKLASGYLICLQLPLYKRGRPWGLTNAVYDELLVTLYMPARTHEIGKSSDSITVWRHRVD